MPIHGPSKGNAGLWGSVSQESLYNLEVCQYSREKTGGAHLVPKRDFAGDLSGGWSLLNKNG